MTSHETSPAQLEGGVCGAPDIEVLADVPSILALVCSMERPVSLRVVLDALRQSYPDVPRENFRKVVGPILAALVNDERLKKCTSRSGTVRYCTQGPEMLE